ncbi:MAG TPA: glycosyl hydrolase family 28-related protein [Pyrinomonadaceae bacterium]
MRKAFGTLVSLALLFGALPLRASAAPPVQDAETRVVDYVRGASGQPPSNQELSARARKAADAARTGALPASPSAAGQSGPPGGTVPPAAGQVTNVKAYGAKGDGKANDTAAIQSAINAVGAAGGGVVFIPRGTYKVTGLTVAANYVRLLGEGWATQIAMSNATGDTITFSNGRTGFTPLEDATYLTGCGVENLRLEPSVTRTSGSEIVAYRYNKLYLNNLCIQNVFQGMLLGRVTDLAITAYVQNLRMRQYIAFGVKMVNVIELYGDGWALDKFDQTNNTYSIWLSGLTSTVCLTNSDIVNSMVSTAAKETTNNVIALYIHDDTGQSGAILLSNYFTNCLFDSHSRGVRGDNGTNNYFTTCFFADRSVAGQPIPGVGVTITAGTDWSFVNCYAMNNGGPGYYVGGNGAVTIMGGGVSGNNYQGFPSTNSYSAGIILDQSDGGNARVIGVSINKNTGIFPTNNQQWGIWITASAGDFTIESNNLQWNNTGAINNLAGIGLNKRIRNNRGYATENSGRATIPTGSTTVNVTHNLGVTPSSQHVRITPISAGNNVFYYVTATSATTFTVTLSGNPGAGGFQFGWSVIVQ